MFARSYDDLERYMNIIFPKPLRFRKVWSKNQSYVSRSTALFLWEPIPPSAEFVALGLVATTSEVEPDPSIVRCVPKEWAPQVEKRQVKQLWVNAGLGGSRTTLWIPGDERSGFFSANSGNDSTIAP